MTPPPPPKPIKFGKPEKPNIWGKVITWVLVIAGLGGIYWMIATNPKQKPLVCKSGFGSSSLNNFGTCTTE